MKKLIIILVLISSRLTAQDFEGYYTASFDFNQPLSNTNQINSLSLGGIKVGYHRLLNEKVSVGGEINWGTYKQYQPKGSFLQDNGSIITTDYFNYVYSYGFTVNGRYLKSYDKKVNLYGGLGVGFAYDKYTRYYNVYSDQQKSGGFLIRPEGGAIIRFNKRKSVSGLIGVHYDYSSSNLPKQGYTAGFTNFGVNVGVVFLDW